MFVLSENCTLAISFLSNISQVLIWEEVAKQLLELRNDLVDLRRPLLRDDDDDDDDDDGDDDDDSSNVVVTW